MTTKKGSSRQTRLIVAASSLLLMLCFVLMFACFAATSAYADGPTRKVNRSVNTTQSTGAQPSTNNQRQRANQRSSNVGIRQWYCTSNISPIKSMCLSSSRSTSPDVHYHQAPQELDLETLVVILLIAFALMIFIFILLKRLGF